MKSGERQAKMHRFSFEIHEIWREDQPKIHGFHQKFMNLAGGPSQKYWLSLDIHENWREDQAKIYDFH